MFVHFGLYALIGRGEWVMYEEDIPRDEYEKLAERFDPHLFDADEWVALAEESGARYINVTAKHHDGFCLFDSDLTDFKITNTPFGRDLIGELVEACHRREMRIVFYYSQPDWHHPCYVHNKGAFKDLDSPPATDTPDWPAYQDFLEGQVRELCTKYGRIDGIWFDGSHKTEEAWRGKRLYEMIKGLQPGAIVNDRARYGDLFTPERSLPEDLTGYLLEACESTSPTSWGYQGDTAVYSVPHLVRSMVRMAAAGGNYLLNVGPKPDGTIPENQAARMRGVGEWLKRYGESVYATEAGPEPTESGPLYTRAGNTAYSHLVEWPATDRLAILGVDALDVERVSLMESSEDLSVVATDSGVEVVGLPASPPDASSNVVRVDLARVPDAVIRRPKEPVAGPVVEVASDSTTSLAPEQAELEGLGVKGARLRVLEDESGSFISHWMVPEHAAHWNVSCRSAVRCAVTVRARCHEPGLGGAEIAVGVDGDGQRLRATVEDIGDPPEWQDLELGEIDLPGGDSRVTLRPHKLLWGYLLAEIGAIELRPVG
jgi:alpha-L-fucosidase